MKSKCVCVLTSWRGRSTCCSVFESRSVPLCVLYRWKYFLPTSTAVLFTIYLNVLCKNKDAKMGNVDILIHINYPVMALSPLENPFISPISIKINFKVRPIPS